jgi:2-polyprenyl-3-methyl-5-hydroxy-6-metoxy-1,4-benzoquinol methylase
VLIELIGKQIQLGNRRVLDFGAGSGALTERLVRRGIDVEAADFSPDALEAVAKRVAGAKQYRGGKLIRDLPSDLEAGAYDVIFFVETIEHLLPDELAPTLSELARLLKRGGHLAVTTRNEEDLAFEKRLCPDCGARFHPMQHQTSWNRATLSALLASHGLRVTHARTLNLRPHFNGVFDLLNSALRIKKVNLVAIAEKIG